MNLEAFKEEMVKLGFAFDPNDCGWHRADGSLASQEAIEDVSNLFTEAVQKFILDGWRGVNQQFDIMLDRADNQVVVVMRDATDGAIVSSATFKMENAIQKT